MIRKAIQPMKTKTFLFATLLPFLFLPLRAEEKTPERVEEERLLREAEEAVEKRKLRVSPGEAQQAKEALIRALQDQFRNPSLSFSALKGSGTISLAQPLTAFQISGLIAELEKSVVRSEKTGTAEWITVWVPALRGYTLRLLVPDFPEDPKAPFHGMKITRGMADVAEFKFTSREEAPHWAALFNDLVSAIARRDAKETARPKPLTRGWTLEQANHVIPRIDFEQTKMRDLVGFYRNGRGCGGEYRMKVDDSLISDRLDRTVADIHEEDITVMMLFCRAADSIDCDLLIGEGSIKFIPRGPKDAEAPATGKGTPSH